jgi:hypothetical protein
LLTPEGADDAEITIRPNDGGGWRIEILRKRGRTFVTVVKDRREALELARQLSPNTDVRLLPADESADTLLDDLSKPAPGTDADETGQSGGA